ncbi:efflux RND transporter periplasmic adaptor subunit [Verticiella sediminum]|uniref:Efflux RND transporter periplasmic adaptor subunit n=1 Tax=Verticiella sediminum TaxID=1247510 RepID=A0A556AX87_9BURK|nr:efflux RND transporter periplasmic adaptor subunit [Verticiella sediminum]TSH97550.1 efflux RND transporter periplasmic adaptor subunit [Verticiella sediminum]
MSSPRRRIYVCIVAVAVTAGAAALFPMQTDSPRNDALAAPSIQPSLSVTVTTLEPRAVQTTVAANGDISAWQEISIGTQISGLRLVDVNVDVGDEVKKGQVLARYASDTVQVELDRSTAAVAEAEATLAEAAANARRARRLKEAGSLSEQQIQQYETAESTARARLRSAQAQVQAQRLRLDQTRIVAPDDGAITSRTATVGAVTGSGQELFRLLRRGRLEWRAEVAAFELEKLRAGQTARVALSGGHELEGRLRTIAPLVDTATRNGLVYVDLPASEVARAGMFARGEFELGTRQALTLPRSAVQIRDGFGYVHRVGDDGRITELKVVLGQHAGDRIEILSGLDPAARVVAAGGAFLGNGDHVRVIEHAKSGNPPSQASSAAPATSTPARQP